MDLTLTTDQDQTLQPQDAPARKKTVFDTIKAISEKRPLKFADMELDELPYQPFLVNRALSLYPDTVILASLMNERSFLDADVQGTFLINAIRPRKRWEKWPKSAIDSEVELISAYYGISRREAQTAVKVHSKEQLSEMRKFLKQHEGVVVQRTT